MNAIARARLLHHHCAGEAGSAQLWQTTTSLYDRRISGGRRHIKSLGEAGGMTGISNERVQWLMRHVVPHEPVLRARIRRWTLPDGLDADDLIQEVYSRFVTMESVGQIRNPQAYLFVVARSIMLMHVRRSRVVSIRALDEYDATTFVANDPSPEDYVSDRQQLHLLAMAVSQLPEPGRRAFLMRTIEELPYREIAENLGITENAAQKSVSKSLVKLMALLGRGGNDLPDASKEEKVDTGDPNGAARNERAD